MNFHKWCTSNLSRNFHDSEIRYPDLMFYHFMTGALVVCVTQLATAVLMIMTSHQANLSI